VSAPRGGGLGRAGASKELEPDDPHALVGNEVDADADADVEMADALLEEFLCLGWEGERLIDLFRRPHFRAAHLVWRRRGETYVRERLARATTRIRPRATASAGGVGPVAPPERAGEVGVPRG
jgi:hypothetical protein